MAAPKNTLTTSLTAADLAAALSAEDAVSPETEVEPEADDELATEREPVAAAPAPVPPKASGRRAPAEPGDVVKKGAPPPVEDAMSAFVTARVTKGGHGKIHNGRGGRYDWNDEIVLPQGVAKALEGRLFAEIVGNA